MSIRDILSWVNFINTTARTLDADSDMQVDSASSSHLDPAVAYVHGACMVFLDALGSGRILFISIHFGLYGWSKQ